MYVHRLKQCASTNRQSAVHTNMLPGTYQQTCSDSATYALACKSQQTDRQTDRQRHRQTDKWKDTVTNTA